MRKKGSEEMDGVGEGWMMARDRFLFLSVFLPLEMQLPCFFIFASTAGGCEVRIALLLFPPPSPPCVQSNAGLSHSRRLGVREGQVTN